MTNVNPEVRDVLSEIDTFFSQTLRSEKVSKKTVLHKEKIQDMIFRLRQNNPELLPKVAEFTRTDEDFIPELAAKDLKNITKAGFLEKRRKKETLFQRGSYQRRYCVIQNGVFFYYAHPTDKKQAGAFHLKGYKFRKAPYLPEDGTKKDLSFELACAGKRSFQFLGEHTLDFKQWKEAVEKSCGEANNNKNPSPEPKKTADTDADIYYYDDGDDDGDDSSADDSDYQVALNSDDENGRHGIRPESYGENYEPITIPGDQDHVRNGNNADKMKPALLPKKAIPLPPKKSQTIRAPMKPPILPKTPTKPVSRLESNTYEDCENRPVTETDIDADDDEDYTEPIEFERYSDGEFDDDFDTSSTRDGEGYVDKRHSESRDIYYDDALSGHSRPRSEVTSEEYQDVAPPPRHR